MDGDLSIQNQTQCLEDTEIQLEENGVEALNIAKSTLVGRFLIKKNLNRNAVKEILSKAWNVKEELNITDLGPNVFLFTFSDKKVADRIMEEGPWYVMSHLLSLQYWIPEATVFEVNYDLVGFWVQIHGLPLDLMSINNASKLAGSIGIIQKVENPVVNGKLIRPFFRVRVMLNIKNPLPTGCWVPRRDLPRLWVMFRYERLQGFCYQCGVIGHDNKRCKKDLAMAAYDQTKPRYGPKLGVPPAKSLAAIAIENINRVKKLNGEEDDEVAEKDKSSNQHQPQGKADQDYGGQQSQGQQEVGQESVETSSKETTTNLSEQVGPTQPDQFSISKNLMLSRVQQHNLNPAPPTVIGPHPVSIQIPETNNPRSQHPPLTRIDLKESTIRPGLGPNSLEDMDIQKEHIGLPEAQIIKDYPSPTKHGTSSYTTHLSPKSIFKCKQFVFSHMRNPTKIPNQGTYTPPNPQPLHSATHKKNPVTTYWVEFPPDEPDTNHNTTPLPEQHSHTLNTLSLGIQEILSFNPDPQRKSTKRLRVNNDNEEERALKNQCTGYLLLPPGESSHTTEKAKEAGQTMPPPQP
ncbi:Zinc finger, CCHC-type [Sesbania bispinosa]|nr:Zinc finger, CCHC-type [Sesbania bispinosa]